jgi:hypothetical protein
MNENIVLSEEYKLMVFENRVLRKIFAPNMKEVAGVLGNFTVDIHDLYSSPKIFGVINFVIWGWVSYEAYMREKINACRVLGGKLNGKRKI